LQLKIVETFLFTQLSNEVQQGLRQKAVETLRDEGTLSTRLTDAFVEELGKQGYPTTGIVFSFGLERKSSEGVAFYGQLTDLQALRNRLLPNSGRTLSNRFLANVSVMVQRVPNAKFRDTMSIKVNPTGGISELQQSSLDALVEALQKDIRETCDKLTTLGRRIIESAGSSEVVDAKLSGEDQLYFTDGTQYLDIYEHGVISKTLE
jgi:hypothetical protein